MLDSGASLGQILEQALNASNKAKEPKMFKFDVKLKAYATSRKINDIKALRSMTVSPVTGEGPESMGLVDAKNTIEYMYDHGTVTVRMTAEQYAIFEYNRKKTPVDYDWDVTSVSIYHPVDEPQVFTF